MNGDAGRKADDSGAAIVCGHVASGRFPILRAKRDEPLNEVDSGWQFLCDSGLEEREEDAKVWSINDVLRFDPSIRGILVFPPGTLFVRKDKESPWVIPGTHH
jgi:hypothetical protein